ncbi:MAG TPA: hypothetical protein DCZ01_11235 [Elusimicrobia bacterium]|nr:hypothetical protein [Elusimicrobiota bacterium]
MLNHSSCGVYFNDIPILQIMLIARFLFVSPIAYASATDSSLQASYNFDEGSGTTAADSSGNSNSGTLNGVTWTTGKSGSALSFSGTGSYVSLSKVLPAMSEFTAAAWVKVSSLTSNPGILTTGGYNGTGFRTWIASDGAIYALMAGNGSYDIMSTVAGVVQTGAFCHITVAGKSGQYMRIYVNGVLVREKTTTQTIGAPTSVGYIGSAWNTNSGLMNGVIDDVRFYTRALAGNEIYSLSGKTSDAIAPTGSITINNNAAATDSAKVTLSLSATDNEVGVAGFYISENLTAPIEGLRGWDIQRDHQRRQRERNGR